MDLGLVNRKCRCGEGIAQFGDLCFPEFTDPAGERLTRKILRPSSKLHNQIIRQITNNNCVVSRTEREELIEFTPDRWNNYETPMSKNTGHACFKLLLLCSSLIYVANIRLNVTIERQGI